MDNQAITNAGGQQAFRPRARLLTTLGAELISSEVVAVIELVRNGWDADATAVTVEFVSPQDPAKAKIIISDDGHGMTRDVLLGPWFEPATSWKRSGTTDRIDPGAGDRSPAGRRRLGSKGVGRFAAQRLGTHLELRSKTHDAPTELQAVFDWAAIERADGYLDEVRIPWDSVAPTMAQGTALVISDLRDAWTWDRFDRLRIGLSRLLSQKLDRSGFHIAVIVDGNRTVIEPALDDSLAMYSMRGRVTDGGGCTIEYRDQTGVTETWERQVVWPRESESCGPFDFHINGWDLDRAALTWFLEKTNSNLGLRDFRRVIREHAGISLYRDGFRILPYGEPDNDWLRLDRRRVNNPTLRLSNNQILGQINLAADANQGLRDQTNREGLVVNDAYTHLQHVVVELLSYLEARRFSARREFPAVPLRAAQPALLPGIADVLARSPAPQGSSADVRRMLDKQRTATVDAIQTYAGLASVGQVAQRVFRQLEHPVKQASTELKRLRMMCAGNEIDPDDVISMRATIDKVMGTLDDLKSRMNRMEPLATQGSAGRAVSSTWREVLSPVVEAFQGDLEAMAICVRFDGNVDDIVDVSPGPIQQSVANMIDNALHWMCEIPRDRTITFSADGPTIRVINNGPRIDDPIRPLVCEASFTTRENAQGLGLTVARDLLGSAGFSLTVEDPSVGVSFLIAPTAT